jgi:hypothetical protein
MDFDLNELHDPNGLNAVASLLPTLGDLSDLQLLEKREEIRRCQTLLKRAQKYVAEVEFSEHVMLLIRALDKAEARESARMISVAA